jgi:hypothetical protein
MAGVHSTITLSDVAALLGMVLGTAGFVIGLMNYLRDRPKVKVHLQWDMVVSGDAAGNKMGIVRVTNVGRRPIYISAATLNEGDAPATFSVNYDSLAQYAKH